MCKTVSFCLCCIPLRTGTLILGYIFVGFTLIGITTSAVTVRSRLVNMENNSHIYFNESNSFGSIVEESLTGDNDLDFPTVIFEILALFMFTGQLIVVIFLITGAYKGKPGFIKCFLIYTVMMPIATFVLNLLEVLEETLPVLIATCVCYTLEFYFLIVIRSYMLKLRENSPNGKPPIEMPTEVYKAYINQI